MMEANPYAAPAATLEEVRAYDARNLQDSKAGRGRRLGARLLDGVINIIWVLPMLWGATMGADVQHGTKPLAPLMGLMLLGLGLALTILVIQCMWVHKYGQTIGKRALDMTMVRTDGSRLGLRRYLFLRVLPIVAIGMIPYVGWLISLIDPLLIFGRERRCLHDLFADTIVVNS